MGWFLKSAKCDIYSYTENTARIIECLIMNNFRGYDAGKIMGGELNYRQQVLDEICLEGLSGITLQVKILLLRCYARILLLEY